MTMTSNCVAQAKHFSLSNRTGTEKNVPKHFILWAVGRTPAFALFHCCRYFFSRKHNTWLLFCACVFAYNNMICYLLCFAFPFFYCTCSISRWILYFHSFWMCVCLWFFFWISLSIGKLMTLYAFAVNRWQSIAYQYSFFFVELCQWLLCKWQTQELLFSR